MSYDAMAYLVSRAVYNYGIAPTDFYTDAFTRQYKKNEKRLSRALTEDVSRFIYDNLPNDIEYKLTM